MKLLMFFGIAVSLAMTTNTAKAEQTVTFEGQVYPLSILTDNCNSKADDPQAMIACFNNLSALLEQQSDDAKADEAQTSETQDDEKLEAERREAERQEAERLEAERREAERLEAERQEAERQEAERRKAELEAERLEAERRQAELEAERLEAERQKADLEAERQEAERRQAELEAKQLEAERRQAELEAKQLEAERLEAERQRRLVVVPQTLDALRSVAQYQDQDSGLSIEGTDCNIRILYFGNYYHLSRRNVSTLDLISAKFDASKLQYDQISDVSGAQVPLLRGVLADGATAETRGGVGMDSALHNFEPKTARSTLDAYASEVDSQLPPSQKQTFDFVLVHPARNQANADVRGAFEAFLNACKE